MNFACFNLPCLTFCVVNTEEIIAYLTKNIPMENCYMVYIPLTLIFLKNKIRCICKIDSCHNLNFTREIRAVVGAATEEW